MFGKLHRVLCAFVLYMFIRSRSSGCCCCCCSELRQQRVTVTCPPLTPSQPSERIKRHTLFHLFQLFWHYWSMLDLLQELNISSQCPPVTRATPCLRLTRCCQTERNGCLIHLQYLKKKSQGELDVSSHSLASCRDFLSLSWVGQRCPLR